MPIVWSEHSSTCIPLLATKALARLRADPSSLRLAWVRGLVPNSHILTSGGSSGGGGGEGVHRSKH